ncbi:EcsC family protein [Irregularibacter muris]|uniref:EcsC family protein n=1 Tax=Irregularibacter muris TaxID=1796619 RepID=A0AAE3HDM9_9FIRM|nr:EcsC family protein [Irregularibacter muris]MCR1897427.1 EcsC family protein [Irregularibacter muris]
MDRQLSKELKKLKKREEKFLNKKENALLKSKIAPMMNKIQEKIPAKLKSTLENAFFKGFQLVFEKGNTYIEKTYDKDKIQLEHDLNNYAVDKKMGKKYIKRLDKQVNHSKLVNSSFSVLEGGVLGVLGIGLPDIPLFIAVIMRTVYEIALNYGYDYKKEEEKAYILLVISGAMTQGSRQQIFNEQLDELGNQIDQQVQGDINLEERIKETAQVLSEAMLTAKFIQGIPVVGAVGGIVNYHMIRKIGRYASVKYKKRYLMKKTENK